MEFTALQIAGLLEGDIEGNPGAVVNRLAKIEEGEEHSLSFLANPAYTPFIYSTNASIVIVNRDFIPEKPVKPTLIRVSDAYKGFACLLEKYNNYKHNKKGVDKASYISQSATLGKDVYIGAFAYIGENVKIGDNAKIYPNAYIGDHATIGADTILFSGAKVCSGCSVGKGSTIHMGVVIGADGFGFTPHINNHYQKVAQTGNVVVEDNVEIGANTTIDRATLGSTIIRKGVKLDNLIQIAHNVEVGENTVIAAQTGIAGSAKIGRDCMIGGQVGIVGHITIGDRVKIAAQSGVTSNIPDDEIIQGAPAFNNSEYKRSYVLFKHLPDVERRIKKIEKELKTMKQITL